MKTRFFIAALVANVALSVAFADPPTRQEQVRKYRQQLGEQNTNENNSRVVTKYSTFKYRLSQMIGNSPFVAMEFMGFSAAGYNNLERLKSEFRNQVRRAYSDRGLNGKLVVVMGGSIDGVGAGYEVLKEMRASGYPDIIVTGMISSAVVEYQLEGVEKGWGDTLSPHQDLLLLLDTYKDASGNQTWELKETPNGTSRTADIALDLSRTPRCGYSAMTLFEGGEIGLKEGVEFAARAKGVERSNKLTLNLMVGYEPSEKQVKKGKDKGPRAATQLALILNENPELRSSQATIVIHDQSGAGTVSAYFDQSPAGPEMVKAASELTSSANLEALQNAVAAEETKDPKSAEANVARANLARAKAMLNTKKVTVDVLSDARADLHRRLDQLASWDSNPNHPVHNNEIGERGLAEEMGRVREAMRAVTESIEKIKDQIREKEVEGRIK